MSCLQSSKNEKPADVRREKKWMEKRKRKRRILHIIVERW